MRITSFISHKCSPVQDQMINVHLAAPARMLLQIVEQFCKRREVTPFQLLSQSMPDLIDCLQEEAALWDTFAETEVKTEFFAPYILEQIRLQALNVCQQQCGKEVQP